MLKDQIISISLLFVTFVVIIIILRYVFNAYRHKRICCITWFYSLDSSMNH